MPRLEFSEIVELNVPQVRALAKVALENPDPTIPAAGAAFSHQVRLVEGAVVTLYTLAVGLAKKEDHLEEVRSIWQRMGGLCDLALETVRQLKDRYPTNGTPELYNLLLDYKLACNDRADRATEELACQTTQLPAGLLPALN